MWNGGVGRGQWINILGGLGTFATRRFFAELGPWESSFCLRFWHVPFIGAGLFFEFFRLIPRFCAEFVWRDFLFFFVDWFGP